MQCAVGFAFLPILGGGDFDAGHVVYAVDEVQVFHGSVSLLERGLQIALHALLC